MSAQENQTINQTLSAAAAGWDNMVERTGKVARATENRRRAVHQIDGAHRSTIGRLTKSAGCKIDLVHKAQHLHEKCPTIFRIGDQVPCMDHHSVICTSGIALTDQYLQRRAGLQLRQADGLTCTMTLVNADRGVAL